MCYKLFSLDLFAEFHLPDGDVFRAVDLQHYHNNSQVLYDPWFSADLQTSSDDIAVDWNCARVCGLVTRQCFWQSKQAQDGQ